MECKKPRVEGLQEEKPKNSKCSGTEDNRSSEDNTAEYRKFSNS